MTISIPVASREYVEVTVSGPAGVTLTSLPVEMAIIPRSAVVAPSDWKTAGWAPGKTNVARLLVGPGSPFGSLTIASYEIWVRVTSGAEIPVRQAGFLTITST